MQLILGECRCSKIDRGGSKVGVVRDCGALGWCGMEKMRDGLCCS